MAKCTNPSYFGPCRRCPACLKSRLRRWLFRMILEAQLYDPDKVTFCTFTYRSEDLPATERDAKEQMQKFLKRLRKVFNLPGNIRYVMALEKGTQATRRFHWHGIIYGLRFSGINRDILERSWSHGFIQWKPSTPGRMAYVLKYVIKGNKFLMSRNPGIGDGMIQAINETLAQLSPIEMDKLLQQDRQYLQKIFLTSQPISNGDVHVNKKTGEVKNASLIRSSTMSPGMAESIQRLKFLNFGGYPFSIDRFIKERLVALRRKKSGS